jgi:hypothetical protein
VKIDLGDVVASFELRVKGLRRYGIRWRIGVPRDTTPADRVVKGPPYATSPGRGDLQMDLQADKQVPLSLQWTDEIGNPVETPADASATYTVDDPTVINLTDNGDGTATAAATGTLGTATVHVETTGGGQTLTGDLSITVVEGLAERVNIAAGEPTEVTPDV